MVVVVVVSHESGPYPEKNFGGGFGNEAPKAPRTSRHESSQVTRPRGRTRRVGGNGEGFGALYSCQKAPRSNHFEYFEVHVFH